MVLTKPKGFKTPVVEFGLKLKNGQTMYIQANVVPKITGMIQRAPINSKQFEPLLKEHQLADTLPRELEVSTVELLIRNDYYSELICKRFQGGPFKLPSMSPWPRKKVAKCSPFTYTELDYFGPCTSKIKVQRKRFGCVSSPVSQSEPSIWN